MSPYAAASPGPEGGVSVRPIRTILLATDLTAASREATDRAVDLASRLGARLLIVNVLEKRRLTGGGSHERVDQARAERETLLVRIVRSARDAGVKAEFLVWEGDPGDSIAAAAEAEQADLVVVGTRGRSGAERMLLGSVSDHVVRHAECPVLVVRPPRRPHQDA
jgi:nucleotide-binding universal stress UspA family protein